MRHISDLFRTFAIVSNLTLTIVRFYIMKIAEGINVDVA